MICEIKSNWKLFAKMYLFQTSNCYDFLETDSLLIFISHYTAEAS